MPFRVLVIDDDPKARELVAVVLEGAGHTVLKAAEGAVGIARADAEQPDVIVLDVEMPGLDGYEVCRRLRQGTRTARIPVVMLTATDDVGLNRKAYAAGVQACVPKPFRREGLIAVIETTLARMSRGDASGPPAKHG